MSKSITQDMAYRQSLMKYAEKYGVSRASRKYNKSRSYIYFWKQRWDGSVASLACQSRRPHSHPNQHTEAELKLIRDMRRRHPSLGMIELWPRLRKRGYTRCPESLFRVMRKMGLFPAGAYNNRCNSIGKVESGSVAEHYLDLLYDPQTSGGLLISVAEKDVKPMLEDFKAANMDTTVSIIGKVAPKSDK